MYYAHYENNIIAYVYNSNTKQSDHEITEAEYIRFNGIAKKEPVDNTLRTINSKIDAIVDRTDFIEDCIAEMAGVDYNTEETTT